MMNICVLEAANHLHNRVDLANVAQELITQSFSSARSFDQPCDVHKLNRRRDRFLRMRQFGKNCQSTIWHGHDTKIRVNRAERIVRRLSFPCAGDSVKEGRFPDVWQANDSS